MAEGEALWCRVGEYQRPSVTFFGGYWDIGSRVMRQVYAEYLPKVDNSTAQNVGQNVSYAQYDQGDLVLDCIRNNYDDFKQKICLIGHSWGGDTAMQCCRKLHSEGKKVALLATLDPVDRFRPLGDHTKPSNVDIWINVYVNYEKAARWGVPNMLATVGGPWGSCPAASVNFEFQDYGKNAHAFASRMFVQNVETTLLAIK